MWHLSNLQTLSEEYRKQIDRELEHARLVRLAEQSRPRQPVLAPVARWTGVRLVCVGARLQDYACACSTLNNVPREAPATFRD